MTHPRLQALPPRAVRDHGLIEPRSRREGDDSARYAHRLRSVLGEDQATQAAARLDADRQFDVGDAVAHAALALDEAQLRVLADLHDHASQARLAGFGGEGQRDVATVMGRDDHPLEPGRGRRRQGAQQAAQIGPTPVLVAARRQRRNVAGLDSPGETGGGETGGGEAGGSETHAASRAYLS